MNTELNGLIKALGDFSTYSTIAAIVLGAISPLIQNFTITKKDFKRKVDLHVENLLEKLISANKKVFKKIYFPDLSPKDENEINDLITEKVKENIRVNRFIIDLNVLYSKLCQMYNYCLYTIILGIILFLMSIGIESLKPYVFILSLIIIITQFIAIKRIINSENKLEDYETKI